MRGSSFNPVCGTCFCHYLTCNGFCWEEAQGCDVVPSDKPQPCTLGAAALTSPHWVAF